VYAPMIKVNIGPIILGVVIGTLAFAAISGVARSLALTTSAPSAAATIHIEDVDRFYEVYAAAGGHPTAGHLQHDYLDPGSDGLHQFAKLRDISGATIAETLAKHPEIYSDAKRCMDVLPSVRRRLQVALRKLGRLYPQARFRPVTIAVGRGKSVVLSNASGLFIGLEALCATDYLNPDVEERFVHVITHEYSHVQQVPALVDDKNPTVLEASLVEGAAEFTAELISGQVAYSQVTGQIKGRGKEIETAFVSDEDKTDLSKWLYNSTPEKPGDLGYWVGSCRPTERSCPRGRLTHTPTPLVPSFCWLGEQEPNSQWLSRTREFRSKARLPNLTPPAEAEFETPCSPGDCS
jgi:hypothetical protein